MSYTSYEYSNLQIHPKVINPAGEVTITADIENTGARAGQEVVQLYIHDTLSSVSTPVKELKGFEKISLQIGEKKRAQFKLTSEDLSLLDRHMEWKVEPELLKLWLAIHHRIYGLRDNSM